MFAVVTGAGRGNRLGPLNNIGHNGSRTDTKRLQSRNDAFRICGGAVSSLHPDATANPKRSGAGSKRGGAGASPRRTDNPWMTTTPTPASASDIGPGDFANVRHFGAVGDGDTSATAAVQRAIDAVASGGGGTVVVPAGGFVVGSLRLRSHVNLHLDAGATLLGSRNVHDFPEWVSRWEGPDAPRRRAAMLYGEGLEDVSVTGRGTIDARGDHWWALQRAAPGKEVLRPLSLRFVESRNVLIEGVTFRNSPMWTVSPLACDDVVIRGIRIHNPPDSPNTDGINPESCRNVRIEGCHVDVGDDCITIKSGKEDDRRRELIPCENITISNCTLLRGHGGVVVGSEMSGSVRNVVISNCVFVGTDRGLRFKSRRGRGGVVEDVRASNLVMDGVMCPVAVNLFYGCGAWGEQKVSDQSPWPVDAGTPRFRRLRFSHLTARGVTGACAYIRGLPEMPVEDVAFDACSFYVDPENETPGEPDMAPGMVKATGAGILARRVNGLAIRDCDIHHVRGPAVKLEESSDVRLRDLVTRHTERMTTEVEGL